MILGLIGPEGSGKSAVMAYVCLMHHAQGGKVLTFPGYHVYLPHSPNGNRQQISTELPLEDWLGMGEELQDVLIAIDEIQQFFDAQRFSSILNKLFGYLAGQRRKRNLAIVYTLQNWRWVDNRIRWLTHVLGKCYDLYWSPWGKEENMKRGELMSLDLYDMKGFFTGEENSPLGGIMLRTKELWPCFDSFSVISPWEGFTKVEVDRPKMKIGFGGEPAPQEEAPPTQRGKLRQGYVE